jgi:IS30 family transposase
MGKHLTYEKRLVIDRMLVKRHSIKEIADALGCHRSTIYREIKRARYLHLKHDLTLEDRYNPEAANEQAEILKTGRGIVPKILQCDANGKEKGR